VGRRSTWSRINKSSVKPTLKSVSPGDIRFVLGTRTMEDILEGLEKLDRVIPGVYSDDTLLYASEVKLYGLEPITEHNGKYQTLHGHVENLYFVGDGAGKSRGIVGSAALGIVAASEIIKK